jgi:crotonobetainyl-CoA:carnitine CoA-transferase CaiB-like acyl-CoA transferase
MAAAPLRGIRVLELAQNLAGPYCGQILADLGAEVIKVERPGGGDAARAWGPPFVAGTGSIFASTNRGKRSVTIDIGGEAGRKALAALVRETDILIEAFRPGSFERMGLGWDTLRGWNPKLLYCSVQAYGEEGPLRELPGYDPLMQAHGGIMSVTGHPATGPARVGTSVIDMGTGMWLAIGVLAALRERDATGEGARISVALYDTALAWNAYHLLGCVEGAAPPGPMGSELPMIAPYGTFPTRDGELMIAAANDQLFRRLCGALGLDAAASDARFATNPERVSNREAVNAVVSEATSSHATAALLQLLRGAGVPCAPIQDMAQVLADPQTAASGMIVAGGGSAAVALPIRHNGVRYPAEGAVPAAGAHTAEVVGGLSAPGA